MYISKFFSIVLPWALVLFCLTSIPQAAEPSFSVDSYIPTKFVDFKWSIGGGFGADGRRDESRANYINAHLSWTERSRSTDRQNLGVSTFTEYRYETIPRFLYLAAGFGGNVRNRNTQTSRYGIDTLGYVESSYDGGDSKDYSLSVFQETDAGQYLFDDFFISAGGKIKTSFSDHPLSKTESVSTDYTYLYDDIVRLEQIDGQYDYKNDQKRLTFDIRLMPGWGRVYEGQYAATALYMVDELRREGVLEREPSAEEMYELTEIIHKYRRQHAIDTRLHKIEALSRVMNFLEDNDISGGTGPYGYLLIQDVWDYFPRYNRPFGFRLRAGTGIDFRASRSQSSNNAITHTLGMQFDQGDPGVLDTIYDSDRDYLTHRYTKSEDRWTYASLMAEYFRPVSMRWQLVFTGEARYYYDAYTTRIEHHILHWNGGLAEDNFEDFYTDYNAYNSIDVQGLAQYIYNSRTTAQFEASYYHRHFNSSVREHVIDNRVNRDTIGPPERLDISEGIMTLRSSIKYRISIPTTLNINLQYHLRSYEVLRATLSDDDDSNYNFWVGISHHLY